MLYINELIIRITYGYQNHGYVHLFECSLQLLLAHVDDKIGRERGSQDIFTVQDLLL